MPSMLRQHTMEQAGFLTVANIIKYEVVKDIYI